MAQMVNRAAQSEMHIGMNTPAFGSVEIHTVVHAGDVGLAIGSERGDLRALLANEIPNISNTLRQHDLRLNQVNFHQGFAFSNNLSQGSDSHARNFVPRFVARHASATGPVPNDSVSPPPAELPLLAPGGLNLLA